ncbi:MAG: ABC transporter permease [Candidatus Thorarchaeota archaeon]
MARKRRKNSKNYRIWSMLLKELRLIQNDKFALLMIFVLPGMIMGTTWVAINQGKATTVSASGKSEDAIVLGVVDLDTTDTYPGQDLSANFTWYLSRSPDLIVIQYATEDEALEALYRDQIDSYAVIRYGFEGNITNDIPAFVDIHISSTNFQSQSTIFSAFSDVVQEFRADHGWVKGEVENRIVREFQPVGDYTAATFGVFLLVFSVFIAVAATAAQAIVGDVPLSRMLLTPATKMEAIISKWLAYSVLGVIQSQFLLILWEGLFGIVPNTDYLTLNVVLGLMSISGSALGILISTMVSTRLQANQSFLFLLFGSMIFGTGFIDVGIIEDIFPLNIGRKMIIDTAFKGVALGQYVNQIILVLEITAALLFMSWFIFSRRRILA